MNQTFIIAEAGVNHNGSLERALAMVDAAVAAGADAIKFQTFKAGQMITAKAPKAEYQKDSGGAKESQLDMVRKLELDEGAHREIISHCRTKGIEFISSPFDMSSVDLLDKLGLSTIKIPSGEITHLPYLRKIGALNRRIFLSTGMADLGEIEDALDILMDQGTLAENITLLHCTTGYPTPFQDVNLNAMQTMHSAFPHVGIGFSDHTPGIEIALGAVALGARVIEKHFTLDKTLEGPDHKASLDPGELLALVTGVRHMEAALGSAVKKPTPTDLANRPIVRKSLVAACAIAKGEIFTPENITAKRPGTGISPMRWDEVLGKTSARNYEKDEPIEP